MRKNIQKVLSDIFPSLGFRLFLIFLCIITGLFIIYTRLNSNLQEQILSDTVQISASQSGDLINKSLYRMMLLNDRENLYETIQTIGSESGVERIRIYDKNGIIKFSTKAEESGNQVDMKAEACYACHNVEKPFTIIPAHEKTRIFRTADESRILGLILPIYNSDECSNSGCHAHDRQKHILGVLDVQMSLAQLDETILKSNRKIQVITYSFLILSTGFIAIAVYLITHRPIHKLKVGTERLAAGDMDYRLDMKRKDELGTLASSFNYMADHLKDAYDELKQWSQNLEERVKDKTAELEEIHKEILRVERMTSLGKMAATVGHELNNPLLGIVTYAKLLQKRVKRVVSKATEKDVILKELELICSESLRCGDIVKNLLIFARDSKPDLQECRLQDVVMRAMALVDHHIKLAEIEAHTAGKVEPDKIICDPDQIVQALVALIVNAREAMQKGGKLNVSIRNSGSNPSMVEISVSDTGVGIPPDVMEKIFEPFFSTKKDKKGVGLGLAVVYGIVKRHSGNIRVESQFNKGTTFTIELPVNPKDAKEPPDVAKIDSNAAVPGAENVE